MISHISMGTNLFELAAVFHDVVMPTLRCHRLETDSAVVAAGQDVPECWVQTPLDGQPASVSNGDYIGFWAEFTDQ